MGKMNINCYSFLHFQTNLYNVAGDYHGNLIFLHYLFLFVFITICRRRIKPTYKVKSVIES